MSKSLGMGFIFYCDSLAFYQKKKKKFPALGTENVGGVLSPQHLNASFYFQGEGKGFSLTAGAGSGDREFLVRRGQEGTRARARCPWETDPTSGPRERKEAPSAPGSRGVSAAASAWEDRERTGAAGGARLRSSRRVGSEGSWAPQSGIPRGQAGGERERGGAPRPGPRLLPRGSAGAAVAGPDSWRLSETVALDGIGSWAHLAP